MKYALLMTVLLTAAAIAGVDPGPDSMGLYFDSGGNTVCTPAGMFTPFNVYLLLMNPTGTTDGFACSVRFAGAPYYIAPGSWEPYPGGPNRIDFNVINAAPFVVNGGAMVLTTLSMMVQATDPLRLYLGPYRQPPGGCSGPAIHSGSTGQWRCCRVSSGDIALPVAQINGACGVVADEAVSFGAIKGLFR